MPDPVLPDPVPPGLVHGPRIAVVGGGIGGLAAAAFLHRAGLTATVHEQAPALTEVGAGLVAAPNAVRLLRRLGVMERFLRRAVPLERAWEFRRWADGSVLSVKRSLTPDGTSTTCRTGPSSGPVTRHWPGPTPWWPTAGSTDTTPRTRPFPDQVSPGGRKGHDDSPRNAARGPSRPSPDQRTCDVMDILLVASAFNSLSQRLYAELSDLGHRVDVVLASPGPDAIRAAVREVRPELVVAPMLKTALPEDVWRERPCLIVHPGPPGDRGPSSLDWAITEEAPDWGVTVLQAEAAMDAGDVWAEASFPVAPVGKSDLYRGEVSDAATAAVLLAVRRFAEGSFKPKPQSDPAVQVVWRDVVRQEQRRIDWETDSTATVLRKLRGADSQPGVLDEVCGREVFLHGGHPEDMLRGQPGEFLATRSGAVCRATRDGAVWIPELRPRKNSGDPAPFRRPAASVLAGFPAPPGTRGIPSSSDRPHWLPEIAAPLSLSPGRTTWTDIRYRQHGDVGFLTFSFPGGAMGTNHCRRMLAAYRYALTRPTSVLVLGGARDFFSNGIHLNVIEASSDPAGESWSNLNAMNDLVEAVLRTTDRLVVAALGGNAAAGGVMLALAADEVWCRTGAVLNPHYRRMGLFGSEYWTYSLPRRVGAETAERLTTEALPMSAASAQRLGLVDRLVPVPAQRFATEVERLIADVAKDPQLTRRITTKATARHADELQRPLAEYRRDELARMRAVFFDPRAPYHALRSAFVRKQPSGSSNPLATGGAC